MLTTKRNKRSLSRMALFYSRRTLLGARTALSARIPWNCSQYSTGRTPNLELADKAVRAPVEGQFRGTNRGFSRAMDPLPSLGWSGEGTISTTDEITELELRAKMVLRSSCLEFRLQAVPSEHGCPHPQHFRDS